MATGRMDEDGVRRRIERHPVEGSVEAMREGFAALADLPADTDGLALERTIRHGLDTLTVAAGNGAPGPHTVHLHGGGYVFGSPDTHRRLACVLARASGGTVHVPAYPLAPEHPWPAQRDAMLDWLGAWFDATEGGGERLRLSGDSAGGHLALSLALALPARHRGRLDALVLFSPNALRDYARSESREDKAARDAMNDPAQDDRLAALAFGGTRADDPEQNPLDRDLSALPPLWLDVGTDEILLDDTLQLARRAALAGVPLSLNVAGDAFHLRQLFAQHWPAADESLERAGRWIADRHAASTG